MWLTDLTVCYSNILCDSINRLLPRNIWDLIYMHTPVGLDVLLKLTNINHCGKKSFSTMFWLQMGKYLSDTTTATPAELLHRLILPSSNFILAQKSLHSKVYSNLISWLAFMSSFSSTQLSQDTL